jgi:hypothetical protein
MTTKLCQQYANEEGQISPSCWVCVWWGEGGGTVSKQPIKNRERNDRLRLIGASRANPRWALSKQDFSSMEYSFRTLPRAWFLLVGLANSASMASGEGHCAANLPIVWNALCVLGS